MMRKKAREIKKLVFRLIAIALLAVVGYFAYQLVKSFTGDDSEIEIDNTPLKVEQIRSILELNTLRFQDEVVVDSTEYYRDGMDATKGTIEKLTNYHQLKNGLTSNGLKRRLTLIVKGELIYGVNLKTKDFTIVPKGDSLVISIPSPELLSINVTPKGTDTFEENGIWKDYERQLLIKKAKQKMINSGIGLKLPQRAKEPLEKLLKSLVRSDKKVVVVFN